MPVRTTLAPLILFCRDLVGDTDTTALTISDSEFEAALDDTRTRVRYERLTAEFSVLPGGSIVYKDYTAEPYLEDTLIVTDTAWNPLDRSLFSEFDAVKGRFSLINSLPLGVYLLGDRFCPFSASASLLENLAARNKANVDTVEVGLGIKSSQAGASMLALAKELRKRARVGSIQFGRSDIA